MQAADASHSQPTTGVPQSWNAPCTVPSSPFLPCRTGKTTSTASSSSFPPRSAASGSFGQPGRSTTSGSSGESHSSDGMRSSGPSYSFQTFSRVMPTGSTSYFSGSRLVSTNIAERSETSYSELFPPNSTAARRRSLMKSDSFRYIARSRPARAFSLCGGRPENARRSRKRTQIYTLHYSIDSPGMQPPRREKRQSREIPCSAPLRRNLPCVFTKVPNPAEIPLTTAPPYYIISG